MGEKKDLEKGLTTKQQTRTLENGFWTKKKKINKGFGPGTKTATWNPSKQRLRLKEIGENKKNRTRTKNNNKNKDLGRTKQKRR